MNCLGIGGEEGDIVVEEAVCIKESWCGSCVGRKGGGQLEGGFGEGNCVWQRTLGCELCGKRGERGLDLVE